MSLTRPGRWNKWMDQIVTKIKILFNKKNNMQKKAKKIIALFKI